MFALQIEKGDGEDDLATVFVPDAPNARSGGVFFVPGDLITPIDVSLSEAMRSLKSFGAGSADIRNRMLPGNAGNEGAATATPQQAYRTRNSAARPRKTAATSRRRRSI